MSCSADDPHSVRMRTLSLGFVILAVSLTLLLQTAIGLKVRPTLRRLSHGGLGGFAAQRVRVGLRHEISDSLSGTRLQFKVSEEEELEVDDGEELDFGQNDNGGASASFLRKLSRGVVPLAASLGFVVTPSSAVAVRVAGAAVGGVAGIVARRAIQSKLSLMTSNDGADKDDDDDDGAGGVGGGGNAPSALSVQTALRAFNNGPPAASIDLAKLEAIAKKAGVASSDLAEFFTFAFCEVVLRAVGEEGSDLTDLSDVVDFAARTELSQAEVADGFALAALRVGAELEKDERGFFVDEFDPAVLEQASRIFFLADKMLGTTGSREGYYGKRLLASLSFFTADQFKVVITDACTQLYQRCVQSVLATPLSFTEEEVETLRTFISASAEVSDFRPASMKAFVAETLQQQLTAALQVSGAGAEKGEKEDGEHGTAMSARLDNYEGLQQVRLADSPPLIRLSSRLADLQTCGIQHTAHSTLSPLYSIYSILIKRPRSRYTHLSYPPVPRPNQLTQHNTTGPQDSRLVTQGVHQHR